MHFPSGANCAFCSYMACFDSEIYSFSELVLYVTYK